jgi:hypothetical protein
MRPDDVPSTELSMRQLVRAFATLAGAAEPQLREMTAVDIKRTRETFGLDATRIEVALRETVEMLSAQAAA